MWCSEAPKEKKECVLVQELFQQRGAEKSMATAAPSVKQVRTCSCFFWTCSHAFVLLPRTKQARAQTLLSGLRFSGQNEADPNVNSLWIRVYLFAGSRSNSD